MLHHPTLDKLAAAAPARHAPGAAPSRLALPAIDDLGFEERLGLLVDRELTDRENRRLQTRLRHARLKQSACLEDLDYPHPARPRQGPHPASSATGQWTRVRASTCSLTRPHWRGQDLDRLRARPAGLPRRASPRRYLRAAPAVRGPAASPTPTAASPNSWRAYAKIDLLHSSTTGGWCPLDAARAARPAGTDSTTATAAVPP